MIRFCRLILLAAFAGSLWAGSDDTFFLRGATVHPISGPEIPDGSILVHDGKIIGVGASLTPPKDVRIVEGKGLHVYPGLIDSATEIGLSEIGAVRETSDVSELGRLNPQLRASVAVNPSSEHIPVTRANGITAVISLPDGEGLSGQASLMHLDGWTTDEMEVSRTAAMHLRMPVIQTVRSRFGEGPPQIPYAEARKTYEKQMQELNEFFESARRYQKARSAAAPEFKPDLKFEAMIPVLEGKVPLLITAVRERAIRDALEFADKQKIKMILAQGEEAWKVAGELKSRNVPVILGETLSLPLDEDDPYDKPFTTPAELYKAGVKFAFGTYNVSASRNLPYQAATAVAFGLPHDEALRAITVNAAQIWGVADKMGSIEEGKWADLMITDGDPLQTQTQVMQVFIKGKAVDMDNKHHRLYEKYLARP